MQKYFFLLCAFVDLLPFIVVLLSHLFVQLQKLITLIPVFYMCSLSKIMLPNLMSV